MLTTYPKISLVMPSFNQAQFLEQAIESVLSQNYPNLEFILLDGGSKDGSLDIIQRYQHHFSFWKSGPDGGQAEALKTGFSMATGDVFCWLNSDDVFLPNALRKVAESFADNPNVNFIYSDRDVIDADNKLISEHRWPFFLIKTHWALGQPLAQECCFWRADLYREVGGINSSLYFIMDYDLFYRMWKIGRFKKSQNKFGCIRIHDETKNSTSQDILKQEMSKALITYGIKQPGYLMHRFLNRFNYLQLAVENFLKHIHVW